MNGRNISRLELVAQQDARKTIAVGMMRAASILLGWDHDVLCFTEVNTNRVMIARAAADGHKRRESK
jgi:hypothetical protein